MVTHIATTKNRVHATFLGMTNEILVGRDDSDGSVSVVEITVPAGGGIPLHTNQREAITWYVLEGALTFVADQETHQIKAGELIAMPANGTHSFANQTEHAARALLICTPGGFEGFLTEVAELLPDQAPDGPPPASAVEAMQAVGARYGLLLHLD
jgi:quercetin dioxygenase-like cupin family protein